MLSIKPYPPSLFKTLMGEYTLHGQDVIMWGQMHKETVIDEYQRITGNTVQPTGLILFPYGYLGFSPNGLISLPGGALGVLEVKCPVKYRDNSIKEIMSEELKGKPAVKGFTRPVKRIE